jgi:SAM-dependent methyltransferase
MDMTTPTPAFDPEKYKRTTTEQWQTAAQAWSDWGPLLRRWLGPATDVMLDLAKVRRGSHVLDVAAGAGDQSLQAAERVGGEGRVLATDISRRILDFAQANARAAGLKLETLAVDGEALDVGEGKFDAVISRVGLIYFPDQLKALAAMKRALKPKGRIGAIVYSTGENNGFFSKPVGLIRQRANLPPPAPGQPGPFSLGGPGVLEGLLTKAGFTDVEVRTVQAPVRMTSAAECTRFERESFGALHTMMASLSEPAKAELWGDIERALAAYEKDGAFEGPCELLVAAATKP